MTVVELSDSDSDVQIKMLSRLGKKERRAFLRGLLRQMKPWLRTFSSSAMDHTGVGSIYSKRAVRRGVPLFEFGEGEPDLIRLGTEIQRRRLKNGMTQAELAVALGLRRSHLSELERGLHAPNAKTRTALERVLGLTIRRNEELNSPASVGF